MDIFTIFDPQLPAYNNIVSMYNSVYHLNNSGKGWGVKASCARFYTPTPRFFEKLQIKSCSNENLTKLLPNTIN
jgi:uncharacterized protein with NAD-binding domain and iron-sulfur cluster